MERWTDRVAVVTGASEGIGEAIVRRLAAEGMRVAALARRQQLLEEIERSVKESGAKGSVKGYICDVSAKDDVTAAFKTIERDFGPISVLVNNAGVLRFTDFNNIDIDGIDLMTDTNYKGVVYCIKAGLESMKQHNISDGNIINISSTAGHTVPHCVVAAYSATKHAINALTKGIRMHLKNENSYIKVSTICPGLVRTAMTQHVSSEKIHALEPEDIAGAVAYTLSLPKHVMVPDMIVEPV